ncbi:hypothetical protein PYK79_41345 [Streptomyces sp. ID05-04B]|uniref:hypothetical protein n=1 Tax=Streptomyces sp. ID05-04B TaxID=3028661 RepID=UPI0029C4E4CF|nr:hypothetical protein [Streptomyces sp. ID05-04B]MDX5568450.1 hypothetical protein [Streptomyces sp. ID05-04B]
MNAKTMQRGEAALRALLNTLTERWQQQLDEYEARAAKGPTDDRYARYASLRATRIRFCITELQIALNTGHLPYDLMTNEELAELGMTRENAETVEIAEMENGR